MLPLQNQQANLFCFPSMQPALFANVSIKTNSQFGKIWATYCGQFFILHCIAKTY